MIHVRRMTFEYPDDLSTVFITGEPEDSWAQLGLSLLLPHLEPYLIRAMKAAREHVTDERLRRDLTGFVLQEGQHFQQHRRFNEHFLGKPGLEGLAVLEAEVAAEYARWTDEKPLAFHLAYAEGFEALTSATAIWFLEQDRSAWHPAAFRLFEWHLVEELEHRHVAFDVYVHVIGDWRNRVKVGWFAQWHLLGFMTRVVEHLAEALPEVIEAHGGRRHHHLRMLQLRRRLVGVLLPRMIRSHAPWYTPHGLPVPPQLEALAARYSAEADHVMEPR
ncbi:MAG: metal-dependent hydrolase [Sandaracinaceae bacterium]